MFDIIGSVVEEWNNSDISQKNARKLEIYCPRNTLFSPSPINLSADEISLRLLKFCNLDDKSGEKRIQEILRARIAKLDKNNKDVYKKIFDYIFQVFDKFGTDVNSPIISIMKRIPVVDTYSQKMAKKLKVIFENSISHYEHTNAGKTFVINLTKIAKRWKLYSVLNGK